MKKTIYALKMELVKINTETDKYGKTLNKAKTVEQILRTSYDGSFARNLTTALENWDNVLEQVSYGSERCGNCFQTFDICECRKGLQHP